MGYYIDEGISGTGTAKRGEFNRLIADCDAGKIDIVLTKSISRFARNTVDLLETVRHLKELSIEVRFEKENINSLSGDGEVMLTLLASFAQEESRSISENVKWGIHKRFQSGEIGVANKHLLGYRYDKAQEKYIIIPEEADAVRWMFQMYIDGVSFQEIANRMNRAGIRSVLGNEFQEASVRQLIFNEVYAGDIRRQKSYIPDPIRKTKIPNRGELPQYYMPDCHEAIIDRETYAKVKAEMRRRTSLLNPTYSFTGLIRCGICGMPYTRKKSNVRGKTYVHWICRSKKEVGMSCSSVNFSEKILKDICSSILGSSVLERERLERQIREIIVLANGDLEFHLTGGETRRWNNIHINDSLHTFLLTESFRDKIRCGQCGNNYHRVNSYGKWVYWYCIGKKRKGIACHSKNYSDFQLRQISAHILGLEQFDEAIFSAQVQEIIVNEDGSLEYHFANGRTKTWQEM